MSEQKLDPMTLHALIDGELPPDEHATALDAANSDEIAGLHYTEFRRLKEVVGGLPAIDAPFGSWQKCVRRLDEIDRSRRAEHFVSRYAWGMAAAVFLLIVGAGSWNRITGQHLGAGDVSHMASLLSPSFRTENPQSGQVGKWLQNQVGPVAINSPSVLRPIRMESGMVGNVRIARLTWQDSEGNLQLYVWPGDEPIDGFEPLHGGPLSAGNLNGQNCVAWNQDHFHLVLSGPRDAAEIEHIAQSMSNGAVSIGAGN